MAGHIHVLAHANLKFISEKSTRKASQDSPPQKEQKHTKTGFLHNRLRIYYQDKKFLYSYCTYFNFIQVTVPKGY